MLLKEQQKQQKKSTFELIRLLDETDIERKISLTAFAITSGLLAGLTIHTIELSKIITSI